MWYKSKIIYDTIYFCSSATGIYEVEVFYFFSTQKSRAHGSSSKIHFFTSIRLRMKC